ncbi:hypothetical protein [Koleobacter methoxysyntrophicus]|uniref:hypothetical protein n=1 Tax=Koleobacter methoxysyntrophicus TaxID=2751313 RepID=UPI0019D5A2F7|nr:hypothetical protein [Koleobacter methoxysyntrophicus]
MPDSSAGGVRCITRSAVTDPDGGGGGGGGGCCSGSTVSRIWPNLSPENISLYCVEA